MKPRPSYRLLIIMCLSVAISACNRQYSPPLPISGAASASPTASPEPTATPPTNRPAAKLPYGADAPMTSTVDDNRLANRGLDQPPPNLNPAQQMAALPPAAGSAPSKAELTSGDVAFFMRALEETAFHFQTSQLALARASDSAVKSYAALLVYDYPQVNNKLQTMARKVGLTLPQTLSEPHRERLEKLMRLSDVEFDKLYLATVGVDSQTQLIALFEKTSQETNDPDLKSFLMGTLPTLQAHLRSAEHLPMHG